MAPGPPFNGPRSPTQWAPGLHSMGPRPPTQWATGPPTQWPQAPPLNGPQAGSTERKPAEQSPPGGSSVQGLGTYLLEPQVGLHNLVDLVLER